VTTKVNQPASLQLVATDLDNDPLTYQITTRPAHGTLAGSGTNYLYAPQPGYLGADTVLFQASDGKDTSKPATIHITVTDQNTPPIAQDFSIQTLINTPTNITLEATDPESSPLHFHVVTHPLNGKITGKGQVITYSPNTFFVGSDRFTFKADDGELDSNIATVSVVVDPGNHPPVSTNQEVFVIENIATPISLAVHDPDGDPLNCPILKGPKNGRLSGLCTNLVYTPKAGFIGSDSFTYKAWDGRIYSAVASVSINILPPPPPAQTPVLQSVVVQADGQVQLVLAAPASKDARVLVSTNLVDWSVLPSRITSGDRLVLDPDGARFSQRFYQIPQYTPSSP